MVEGVATLGSTARKIVLEAIQEVCRHEGWALYAVHVRQTHVHVVLWPGSERPEYVLGKLKSCASRRLNERFGHRLKQWARHGSTRWLWSPPEVDAAIDYVLRRQGRPMELYEKIDRWSGLLYGDGVTRQERSGTSAAASTPGLVNAGSRRRLGLSGIGCVVLS